MKHHVVFPKKWSHYGFWLLLMLSIVPVLTNAQNKKNLEDKRKKLTREIEVTSKLLNKTKENKSAVYDRFLTLQNQIDRREDLIQTIENEVVESEEIIDRNSSVIESLNQDIARMKAEYGKMIRHVYRRKVLHNPFLFLLSAENLNQAYRRWLFLRKYNRFRIGQAEAISYTQAMLSKKIISIGQEKTEKEQLLQEMNGQKGSLSSELNDKNVLLQSLSSDEVLLRKELADKQKAKAELDNSIEKVINAEVRKKEESNADRRRILAAEKTAQEQQAKSQATQEKTTKIINPPKTEPVKTEPTPAQKTKEAKPPPVVAARKTPDESDESEVLEEEDLASQSFKRQRGRLPWPVEGGFIARSFGRQKHPTLKNIEITNNGIDIRSDEDAPVKNIFEGKVAGVQFIPGHDYTVIIQHGNYYTVYSNLSETNLNKGDTVGAGVVIGRVSTNPISGASELHFELWREKERLNPAIWIK